MRSRAITIALAIALAVSACAPATPRPTGSAAAARLATAVEALRAQQDAPGALGVLLEGDEVTHATSGSASLDAERQIGPDTRFRIASITKPLVAALALVAAERGELDLDDAAGDLVPQLRREPPVTIRQLLSHTSGVFDEGNEGDPIADIAKLDDPALRDAAESVLVRLRAGVPAIAPGAVIVGLAETHDRYFAPGEGYHYSNPNYQAVGIALEAATGMPLAEQLATRLAEPLGLERMSLAPPDLDSPELRGYLAGTGDAPVDVTDDLALFGNGGNGGVIATGEELARALRGIVRGELFGQDLVTEMTTPVYGTYGLGISTYWFRCGQFLGHAGSVNGTDSIALVSPDGDTALVLAVNLHHSTPPNLNATAEAVLCGAPDTPE